MRRVGGRERKTGPGRPPPPRSEEKGGEGRGAGWGRSEEKEGRTGLFRDRGPAQCAAFV